MTITVTANDIHDARAKVGLRWQSGDITIKWRRGDDYGRIRKPGCIVTAESDEVPRKFDSAGEAVRYIAALLKEHDSVVRAEKKKYDKELRQISKRVAKQI